MIKKLKLLVLSFSSIIMFALPMAIAAPAYAAFDQTNINSNLCSGSNGDLTGQTSGNCNDQASNSVSHLITVVVNVLSVIVGVVAVIMIIFGGFRYITSAGNPEGAKSARSTILYAIIGLVVVALAQLIVHFVLNKTTTATTG
jgi:cytochrome bd-type quinol oxidase subunit 2